MSFNNESLETIKTNYSAKLADEIFNESFQTISKCQQFSKDLVEDLFKPIFSDISNIMELRIETKENNDEFFNSSSQFASYLNNNNHDSMFSSLLSNSKLGNYVPRRHSTEIALNGSKAMLKNEHKNSHMSILNSIQAPSSTEELKSNKIDYCLNVKENEEFVTRRHSFNTIELNQSNNKKKLSLELKNDLNDKTESSSENLDKSFGKQNKLILFKHNKKPIINFSFGDAAPSSSSNRHTDTETHSDCSIIEDEEKPSSSHKPATQYTKVSIKKFLNKSSTRTKNSKHANKSKPHENYYDENDTSSERLRSSIFVNKFLNELWTDSFQEIKTLKE
jgi:hypothetical protein